MDENYLSCNRLGKMPLKSQRYRNPFLLKIDQKSLTGDNYKEGVLLNITCECSFWLFSFWSVKIKEFHQKLVLDWVTIRNLLIDNQFSSDIALYSNDPELYKDEYNRITHKVDAPKSLDLTFSESNQRERYPLAIVLILNDSDTEEQIQGNDIVILVSIIHLKDNLIPLETSVIAQYIKRKSGLILNLQDLYISNDYGDENNMPYCVICQENAITRALLPCRHACVCSECFERINLCPLCRFTIQNFLLINQPIVSEPNNISQAASQEPKSSSENVGFFKKITNFFK